MLTHAAARPRATDLTHLDGVASRHDLRLLGIGPGKVAAQLAAHRWRSVGTAIVLHNGGLTEAQRERVALINCGPRSVPTSFTAARRWGLKKWERSEIHVLAPAGTRKPTLRGIVLHRCGDWEHVPIHEARRLHQLAPALLIAAGSFQTPRPACGILAASVQQRLLKADELQRALADFPRLRHRAALILAIGDIEQGAHALSEIDFARLCAKHRLPRPSRQAVRKEPTGRRRYLDVEWDLPDGRRIVAEIDGAAHIAIDEWVPDQLRQNEVVIDGALVLRFPSVVVRHTPEVVIAQLRRVLMPLGC